MATPWECPVWSAVCAQWWGRRDWSCCSWRYKSIMFWNSFLKILIIFVPFVWQPLLHRHGLHIHQIMHLKRERTYQLSSNSVKELESSTYGMQGIQGIQPHPPSLHGLSRYCQFVCAIIISINQVLRGWLDCRRRRCVGSASWIVCSVGAAILVISSVGAAILVSSSISATPWVCPVWSAVFAQWWWWSCSCWRFEEFISLTRYLSFNHIFTRHSWARWWASAAARNPWNAHRFAVALVVTRLA